MSSSVRGRRAPSSTPLAALAALMVLAAAPVPASAQDFARLRIGAGAGVNLPNGELGDATRTGIVFQPYVSLGLFPGARLRAELHYSRADLDAPFIRERNGVPLPDDGFLSTSGNVSILGGSLNLMLGVPPNLMVVQPYVIGGYGWYSLNVTQDLETDLEEFRRLTQDEGEVGWNAGAGVRFPLWILTGYVEARYFSVDTRAGRGERTTFVPVMIGLQF